MKKFLKDPINTMFMAIDARSLLKSILFTIFQWVILLFPILILAAMILEKNNV